MGHSLFLHGSFCLLLCNYLIYWYIVNFKLVWDKMSQSWGRLFSKNVIYLEPIPKLTIDMYEFTPNNDSAGKMNEG